MTPAIPTVSGYLIFPFWSVLYLVFLLCFCFCILFIFDIFPGTHVHTQGYTGSYALVDAQQSLKWTQGFIENSQQNRVTCGGVAFDNSLYIFSVRSGACKKSLLRPSLFCLFCIVLFVLSVPRPRS